MREVTVVPRQSWMDLAIQCYGNPDGLMALLEDNAGEDEIDLSLACALPTVQVRLTDPLIDTRALKALNGAIIATM